MTIRVPLRLRRQSRAAPAEALYVPGRSPAELLSICAAMDLDPSGRVFAVAGGFVLVLPQPVAGCVAGTIRLKELSAGLYLPADAELVPALLEDEAAGVVRDRGLLFLQGGRVLAFDRGAAIEISGLLEARPGRAAAGLHCPSRRGRPSGSPRSSSNCPTRSRRNLPGDPQGDESP